MVFLAAGSYHHHIAVNIGTELSNQVDQGPGGHAAGTAHVLVATFALQQEVVRQDFSLRVRLRLRCQNAATGTPSRSSTRC